MNKLELVNISKRFGGLQALSDVSFAVDKNDFVGLIGANGAGKTTLFGIIAGHTPQTAGDVLLDGVVVHRESIWRLSEKGVSRTFQIMRPFRELTVRENIAVGALYGGQPRCSQAQADVLVEELIDRLGLGDAADRLARELTLGMQKRLEIARALATRPSLLLLDEVLSGLTPSEVEDAAVVIRRVHQEFGLTIIMVEHVLRAVMQLCNRVVVLHHGEKISEGTPAQVTQDPLVIKAYLGDDA